MSAGRLPIDPRILGLSILFVAGCSRFGADTADTTAPPAPDPFADVRDDPAPAEAVSTSTPSATGGDPTATAPGRTIIRDGVENRSTIEEDGWRLEFTVGADGPRPANARIPFEVRLVNTSAVTRHHEIDQPDLAAIASFPDGTERVWSSRRCRPGGDIDDDPPAGLRAVESGESVNFVTPYPAGGGSAGDCTLPPGEYVVFGRVLVCPDDARQATALSGTFVCAEGRARFLESGPVHLRLTAPA